MSDLKRSLSQHGIEISGWLLPPSVSLGDSLPESDVPDANGRLQVQVSPPALLPNTLGAVLRQFAERAGAPAEAYYLVLLCVAASLIPSRTSVLLDPSDKISVPPILWGGLVGDVGSGKSRIISTLTRPFKEIQAEHYARYQQQLKNYEAALQAYERRRMVAGDPPERPTPVELYTSDCAVDVVEQILVRQPDRGLLIDLDDLAIFLRSTADRQGERRINRSRWLDLYEGLAPRNGLGVTGRIPVPHPSVSVVGGIQHSDFQTLWSKRTRHGERLWACFAWVKVLHAPDTQDDLVYNSRTLLYTVYRRLQASPPMQHVLDEEGQQLWISWSDEIVGSSLGEGEPGIRELLLETGERAVRIALVLHRLDAACAGVIPSKILPANTLARGMEFARRLQKQAETIFFEIWSSSGQQDYGRQCSRRMVSLRDLFDR